VVVREANSKCVLTLALALPSALRYTITITVTVCSVFTLTLAITQLSCWVSHVSTLLHRTNYQLRFFATSHYTTLHHTYLLYTTLYFPTHHHIPLHHTSHHHTTHHCAGKCETIGPDPEEQGGIGYLDGDTTLSQGSFSAAMHAAGSVCEAVDMVIKKKVREG
jgi:acetoin utilization deacetylase AcuC-like enzyme